MRGCIPLRVWTVLYKCNNAKRINFPKVLYGQFSKSVGAPALSLCMLAKQDVSKFKEETSTDVLNVVYGKDLSLRNAVQGCDRHVVDRGWLLPDPALCNRWLKMCAELGDIRKGKSVHAQVIKSEFNDDVEICNNIVYMYGKCGSLDEAHKIFVDMPFRDTFTWTAMVIAYLQNGRPEKALSLFPEMLHLGFRPNKFTFSSLIKASGAVSSENDGTKLHALCMKYGYDSSVYVGTALMNMYAKFGSMAEAQLIFDGLQSKNIVSWNTLIAGHARKGEGDKALKLFQRMKREDFEPDKFTYSSVLSSCASAGALEQGKWIHAHVIKSGLKLVDFIGNTLLHMYGKCGSIEGAEKVFTRLPERDVLSWNSMLTGYAQHGLGHKSLEQFKDMLYTGIQPNGITFLCLLTACSHAGLVEEGLYYLNMMRLYGLEPKVEHYVTMVDLLGRAGKLDQALRFIRNLPIKPVVEMWKALLSACKMHKTLELGLYAAERIFEIDPCDPGPYIILSNIYASAGRKSDVAEVRKMMKKCNTRKEPACSWVEIENAVHVFVADDDTHPQSKEMYRTWESICGKIKEFGYVPDTSQVLLFVNEYEREAKLQHHSEKLALAFAVLNTPPGSTIRIKKNIRVCGDCHSAFKFASRVMERKIILRDTNRFHHFQDGYCSCGDYW